MELVNNCKPQGEIKHKQTQETVRGGSHISLASAREDSGNGSSDEESQQNGDIVTQHLSSENKPSGDEETKQAQNTSCGRSVACNGVEQERVSDKSSSSNCFGSSSGLKRPAKKLERQDSVNIPLPQDHIGNSLQTPVVICSYEDSCSEKQSGNFNTHSTDTFESPKEGIQSHENASERNQDNKINQSHLAVEELQNHMHEGNQASAADLHEDNIPRCLYVPCSPENMSSHPPEFMSLPVSPSDLVPKHIMNSLGRELIRERWNVKMLQVENKQLRMEFYKLNASYQALEMQSNTSIAYYEKEWTLHIKNISYMKQASDSWQKKFNEKEKELAASQQSLHDCKQTYKQLEIQHSALNKKLLEEEGKNKKLNNEYCNLRQTLQKERTRFARDEKCFQEKIDKLMKDNQWLKEGLAECQDCPMAVTPKHTETKSRVIQSSETQPKGVYPENNVCQKQVTTSKQNPKEYIHYKTQKTDLASPKLNCIKAGSQKTILPDVEKCPNCYAEVTKFNSYLDFKEHIKKCE